MLSTPRHQSGQGFSTHFPADAVCSQSDPIDQLIDDVVAYDHCGLIISLIICRRRLPKAFAPERILSALRALLRDGLIEPGTRTDAFVITAQDASSPASPERAAESLGLAEDEEKILAWVRKNGSASRGDIAELLGLPAQTAYRRLAKLCRLGLLTGTGERRHRRYVPIEEPQR